MRVEPAWLTYLKQWGGYAIKLFGRILIGTGGEFKPGAKKRPRRQILAVCDQAIAGTYKRHDLFWTGVDRLLLNYRFSAEWCCWRFSPLQKNCSWSSIASFLGTDKLHWAHWTVSLYLTRILHELHTPSLASWFHKEFVSAGCMNNYTASSKNPLWNQYHAW